MLGGFRLWAFFGFFVRILRFRCFRDWAFWGVCFLGFRLFGV